MDYSVHLVGCHNGKDSVHENSVSSSDVTVIGKDFYLSNAFILNLTLTTIAEHNYRVNGVDCPNFDTDQN